MKYNSIQICRGMAAVLVVLLHVGNIAADYYHPAFRFPISFGKSGVYFFFVLSGFLITLIHQKDLDQPDRFANYAWRRLARIYPVYWVIFLGVLISKLLLPQHSVLIPDFWELLKGLFLIPQEKVGGAATSEVYAPILVVAWTLQYEMIFYLAFGLLIASRHVAFFVAGVGALLAIHCSFFPESCVLPFSFLKPEYFVLFLAGAGVALLHKKGQILANPLAIAAAGGLLFLALALQTITNRIFPEFGIIEHHSGTEILVYGFASCVILFGLVQAESSGTQFSWKFPVLLGEASYSLYLLHFPLIVFMCKLSVKTGINGFLFAQIGVAGYILEFMALFTTSLLVAILFYLYIERPLLGFLSSLSFKTPRWIYASRS